MSHSPAEKVSQPPNEYLAGWDAIYEMVRQDGSWSGREANCAFLNTRALRFADVSSVTGLDYIDDGRGAAVVDWDQDGSLDLWVCNRTGPRARFLRNTLAAESRYVAVKLEGTSCNRDGIGARVELYIGGPNARRLVKTLRAADGYLAQSSKWIHFGLGDASSIDRLVVRWPGGEAEEIAGLEPGKRYLIRQGAGGATAWHRQESNIRLAASPVQPPPETEQAVIPLIARLPMPSLSYADAQGRGIALTPLPGQPTLINLWAEWCEPCGRELADWTQSHQQLSKAGLRVVALNVDGPEKAGPAGRFLEKLDWPFQSGLATPELLDKLDVIQRGVLDSHRPLPLPTSFLIDAQGRLAVLYRGPVPAADVLADVARLDSDPEDFRNWAVPFAGRWHLPAPGPDLVAIADRFRQQGFTETAQEYLEMSARVTTGGTRLASIQYNLGRALAKEKKWIEAADAYRKAIAADPAHIKARVNLGIALRELGDTEAAIAEYKQALEIDPQHVLAHHNLAVALHSAGRTDEANLHYGIAQQLQAQANTRPASGTQPEEGP